MDDNENQFSLDELRVDTQVLANFNQQRYYSKLDKLLAQPDIFSTLRKIEAG